MSFDWTPYVTGGATRPDSFSGMNTDFQSALAQLFEMAPEEIRQQLQVKSGYRSVARQEELWQGALNKYGSPEAARKWVAPPGKSQHGHGNAADLGYLSPDARAWAHENAGKVGLAFPLSNEPWHVELASARGGAQPPQSMAGVGSPNTPQPQPGLQPNDMPPGLLSGIGSPNNPQLQPQQQPMMAQGADPWGGMRQATANPTMDKLSTALTALQTMTDNQSNEQQQIQAPPPPQPGRPGPYTPPQMLSLLAPRSYR